MNRKQALDPCRRQFLEDFRAHVQERRDARSWTYEELGLKCGISKSKIIRLLNSTCDISDTDLQKIARALGLKFRIDEKDHYLGSHPSHPPESGAPKPDYGLGEQIPELLMRDLPQTMILLSLPYCVMPNQLTKDFHQGHYKKYLGIPECEEKMQRLEKWSEKMCGKLQDKSNSALLDLFIFRSNLAEFANSKGPYSHFGEEARDTCWGHVVRACEVGRLQIHVIPDETIEDWKYRTFRYYLRNLLGIVIIDGNYVTTRDVNDNVSLYNRRTDKVQRVNVGRWLLFVRNLERIAPPMESFQELRNLPSQLKTNP